MVLLCSWLNLEHRAQFPVRLFSKSGVERFRLRVSGRRWCLMLSKLRREGLPAVLVHITVREDRCGTIALEHSPSSSAPTDFGKCRGQNSKYFPISLKSKHSLILLQAEPFCSLR